jgi:hypothetical protein
MAAVLTVPLLRQAAMAVVKLDRMEVISTTQVLLPLVVVVQERMEQRQVLLQLVLRPVRPAAAEAVAVVQGHQ